jgi:hypothetical protein
MGMPDAPASAPCAIAERATVTARPVYDRCVTIPAIGWGQGRHPVRVAIAFHRFRGSVARQGS